MLPRRRMAFSHVIYTSGVFFLTVAIALIAVVALTLRFGSAKGTFPASRLHIAGCDRSIPLRLPDFVLAAGHPGEQVDSLLRLARSPVSCDVFHARRSPGEHIRQSRRIVTRAWEAWSCFAISRISSASEGFLR
jgi:hypothetical protein